MLEMPVAQVQQNPVQPCVNRGVSAIPARRAERLDESVLDEILCVRFVAAKRTSRTQQSSAMRLEAASDFSDGL
jgi:hypothetical protein